MAKKERQIGKNQPPAKKPLIDPRYKNTFWTGIFIIVMIVFFIINNTNDEPEKGPYPPGYSSDTAKTYLNGSEVDSNLEIK